MSRRIICGLLILMMIPLASRSEEKDYLQRSDTAAQWFFETLPTHLGHDFFESFLNQPAFFIWASGGLTTTLVSFKDDAIQKSLGVSNNPLGPSASFFNQLGASYTLGGLSLLSVMVGHFIQNEKLKQLSEQLVESLLLTQLATISLKYGTRRERPDGSDNLSFPSGHASASFAFATSVTEVYGLWAGIPSYALASLVSMARLDSNKHFASDVLFGATLGSAFGLGTARFHKNKKNSFWIIPQIREENRGLAIVSLF